MSLFQNSVVNKYLNTQNKNLVLEQWTVFQNHFHNPKIQENIRNSKEEQYQEGFLRDLFVKILGYTLNPDSDFNLTTELKNVKDSKKADGAILLTRGLNPLPITVAVIELKGTNTTDLSKIETQAFSYKNNQKDCVYVITSNFEKVRFYIDNAIENIEFNLFQLTFKEFELLYLCLAYTNIANDIPKKIKEESINQEDVITKKLYKDYSQFKQELYQNLLELNPQYDAIDLYKKSQKLLDRFLFVFFAEDRYLLPKYSVRDIILKDWKTFRDWNDYRPLYEHYKTYFGFLAKGLYNETHDIFAYNGGLFESDSILDNVKIDDQLLYDNTLKISKYDFLSEVDVNILGHIFENSLNELDQIKTQNDTANAEKTVSKRKKDGVFYTPKYITKYIVNNTVGKLCADKKEEFQIIESEFFIDKKRTNDSKKTLLNKLTEYRNWLLQITIIDPACGSGAFLNEALNFLIDEHQYIDELQAKLFGDGLILSDVEMSILENNLFGVDLNEESVEIAKLSLWLRTARPNRKLNNLNNNIKCGNSLIDDPAIAGDKAFNWQNEFPKIFEKGGFDVVIGNPPYVTFALGKNQNFEEIEINYLKDKYPTSSAYKVNSYLIFIERSLQLINQKGLLSFIVPNTLYTNYFYANYRKFIVKNTTIELLCNLKYEVFEDAETGGTSIFVLSKNKPTLAKLITANNESEFEFPSEININQNDFLELPDNKFLFSSLLISIWKKCFNNSKSLNSKNFVFYNGIKTGDNEKFISVTKLNDNYKPVIRGRDFYKYTYPKNNVFVLFDKELLWSNTNDKMYDVEEKLIFRQTSDHLVVTFDNLQNYTMDTTHILFDNSNEFNHKFLLTILNSKLLNRLYQMIVPEIGKAFSEVKGVNLKQLPIKITSKEDQQPFIEKAELMLSLNKDLQDISQKAQRNIQREFQLNDLPKKLQDWYLLSYTDFLKELEKKKVKLSLSQKSEWESYFATESQKANNLKQQIETTDKQIDTMVYQLYGLTDEEINIVEQE